MTKDIWTLDRYPACKHVLRHRSQPREGPLTRRKLINALLALTGISTFFGFLAPVLAYLSPLSQSQLGTAEFQSADGTAIPPDGIAEGAAQVGSLSGRPTLIIRQNGQLLAFDAVCTHLGCIVRWSAPEKSIVCPCHGGVFDLSGKVTAGPPPADLTRIVLKVDGNRIFRA